MDYGYGLIIIGAMLIFNAIFAAYEMALASISRIKLCALVNMNRKGAKDALYMKDRMEGSLAVVQLGITLFGAIAAATGGVGVDTYLSPIIMEHWHLSAYSADVIALIFLIVPLSCLTIIFAELIPKTYAINHQVRVCLGLSPVMKVLSFVFYPIIRILEALVKSIMVLIDRRAKYKDNMEENTGLHELTAAAALARTSRLLGAREERIVLSAAQLSLRMVKEIMLPIAEVSMISSQSSLSDALIKAHLDMHTRFPVCRDESDFQSIEGYINFKDIMAGLKLNPSNPSVKGIMRPMKTVSTSTAISVVLEQMIADKVHIMLVADNHQKIVGMVTLEDIIEELVGEIEDEFDRIPHYIHPYGDSSWLMGGGVTMGTFAQTLAVTWPELGLGEDKMKLSDWFGQKIKQPLKGSEVVEFSGVQITVRKLRRKKLGEAIVTKMR